MMLRVGMLLFCLFLVGCGTIDNQVFQPPEPTYTVQYPFQYLPKSNPKIAAYYKAQPTKNIVFLISHGNGEDIGQLKPWFDGFYSQGYSVLAYDYTGYGQSLGEPSEEYTYKNIEDAYQFLLLEGFKPHQIFLIGRSLGSGPSCYLGEKESVGGIALQGAFTSVYRIYTRWGMIPYDYYPNIRRIQNINCPTLIMHGQSDEIIPFYHAEQLYELSPAKQKFYYWPRHVGHNDVYLKSEKQYWIALKKLINSK